VPSCRIADPERRDIVRVDGRRCALVIAVLLEHPDPAVRSIGARWLDEPATAYQLPVASLERWLSAPGPCGDRLEPRVAEEGLALLGPEVLTRLARASSRATVRAAAAAWDHRVTAGV
jgi:hypothetical protein